MPIKLDKNYIYAKIEIAKKFTCRQPVTTGPKDDSPIILASELGVIISEDAYCIIDDDYRESREIRAKWIDDRFYELITQEMIKDGFFK